eukprot:4219281-Heterocapsa_arctica.AAC.1
MHSLAPQHDSALVAERDEQPIDAVTVADTVHWDPVYLERFSYLVIALMTGAGKTTFFLWRLAQMGYHVCAVVPSA